MKNPESSDTIRAFLENLSIKDFKNFGLHQIGYVRQEHALGDTVFRIYAADGEFIGTSGNLKEAVEKAKNNDIEPVTVH